MRNAHHKTANESRNRPFLTGMLLGAAAMYWLDPDRGRRRRAIARDKARHAWLRTGHLANAAVRDAWLRLRGLAARMRRGVGDDAELDDLRLIERVRATIGRVVGNPHGIHVGASKGCVVLSGHVLAQESTPLVDAARSVRGVREVADHLVRHENPGSVSSLQGAVARSRLRANRGRQWTPALRGAAFAGGSFLLLRGFRKGDLASTVSAAIGLALAIRAGLGSQPARMIREDNVADSSARESSIGGNLKVDNKPAPSR